MVGWLLVGWLLVVGWLVVSGWWLVVGWAVGAWWLVGLLLVLCGWWSASGYKVDPNYLVPPTSNLIRRWLGAGGGKLWLGWWVVGSVVGRLGRKPRFSLGFSRFLGGEANSEHTPPLFGLPASRAVFFEVFGQNVIFV